MHNDVLARIPARAPSTLRASFTAEANVPTGVPGGSGLMCWKTFFTSAFQLGGSLVSIGFWPVAALWPRPLPPRSGRSHPWQFSGHLCLLGIQQSMKSELNSFLLIWLLNGIRACDNTDCHSNEDKCSFDDPDVHSCILQFEVGSFSDGEQRTSDNPTNCCSTRFDVSELAEYCVCPIFTMRRHYPSHQPNDGGSADQSVDAFGHQARPGDRSRGLMPSRSACSIA